MKVLFFPNYLGGGFGHIGRCLSLADAFRRRGGDIAFGLNGPHIKRVIKAGYKIHKISTPHLSKSQLHGPAYVYLSGMAYQIVRDGFDHPKKVNRCLSEALKIVQKTKPDFLVGDGYPITWLVAHKAGIPVVQLVKSVAHPQSERMVWWEKDPVNIIPPDPKPVFNPVLNKIGLPEITRAEQLLSGDLLILPSIPILDPMNPLPSNTYYVGPIIRSPSADKHLPLWLSELRDDEPVIFVTVGGAAGHIGKSEFFKLVTEAFEETDWQVIVSTGGKIAPESVGRMPSNIRLVQWVPGAEMIARSQLVIFHGGYTRMEILMQGLPSIIIPFHSEQEYYGRLLEKAGVARVVQYSNEPYQCIKRYWKGGNRWRKTELFTVHVKLKMTLQPNTLKEVAEFSLLDKKMKLNSQAIKAKLKNYGGPEMTIDLIENKVM